MAVHKKAAALLLVLACMLSCSARLLQPSILSPIAKSPNEEGRVHIAVQPDDVVEIKGPHKRIDREIDDVMKTSTKMKFSNRLNVVHSGRSRIQNPISTDSISGKDEESGSFKRNYVSKQPEVKFDDVGSFTDPVFGGMLPKGPVPPSGPCCHGQ
ncbi:hypothetical protein SUGI_0798870 [Cryptomeria japonica]|uniref:uncharacterized protein LOC131046343 n=1 Tax=Cryptomeria japonica TaxID=3369 RepID=UPI002414AF18|nr:uncharacterized protein LOC131046343 [Cryptomeria japonica]GLJ39187.1 hypothetical protein SUGI_0798870 [Cryptomeria japonica]